MFFQEGWLEKGMREEQQQLERRVVVESYFQNEGGLYMPEGREKEALGAEQVENAQECGLLYEAISQRGPKRLGSVYNYQIYALRCQGYDFSQKSVFL